MTETLTLVLGIAAFLVQVVPSAPHSLQLFLAVCLIRGVNKRSLSLLSFFLFGIVSRIFLLVLFCFFILVAFLLDLKGSWIAKDACGAREIPLATSFGKLL